MILHVYQGFFYSGFGDIVVCAFCGLSLNKRLPNDDPITEHRKCIMIVNLCVYFKTKILIQIG